MASPPHAHGGLHMKPPFRVPGGVSEGRPDLIHLLQAREDHEKRVREGELERRGFAEERRSAARANARSKSPSGRHRDGGSGGGDDSPPPGKFGLAALGFVPPGMVASGTLAALTAGGFGKAPPSAEPSKRPAPPSAVGVYRHRERVFDGKHPDLQALRQHGLERTDRAAAFASASANATTLVVADAFEEARGGGSVGGGGGSPAGSASPGSGSLTGGGLSPTGGVFSRDSFARSGAVPPLAVPPNIWSEVGGGGATSLVRVGVPVDELLESATASAVRAATASRSSRLHTARESGVRLSPGHIFSARDSDSNYIIDESQKVAFTMATRDLPRAAMRAVKTLLHQRPVTVADVHQRRPPFYDAGPPLINADYEPPARSFPQILRRTNGVVPPSSKKKAWIGGSVSAFTRSPYTPAALSTFDFFAREHAEVRSAF